ncbi:MAG: hypothetical protein Q9M43_03690 [Sulfurimonas sp.]|nr:hypothetical protein [Sulfurimonas sp.]
MIFSALEIGNIITLLVKSVLFGFVLAVIPIYKTLKYPDARHSTSKIFLILFLLEILFILIPKAFNAL